MSILSKYKKSKLLKEFKKISKGYKHNIRNTTHHIENINNMTLIDFVEMFADWYSAKKIRE